MAGMTKDPRTRAQAVFLGGGTACHHQRRRTIRNR